MQGSTLVSLALLSFLYAYPMAVSPYTQSEIEGVKVIVAKEDIKLYPRFNKSLKPITTIQQGQKLTILREFKAWMQVQVEGTDQKGWIQVKVEKSSSFTGKSYDIVAAPSTTGLVARGWSKDYAARHGTDFSKVEEIKKRTLDPDRYAKFLKGGQNK